MIAGHMGGTSGSGIVSSATDVLWMIWDASLLFKNFTQLQQVRA